MRNHQLIVFFVLLGVALAADSVGLSFLQSYSMAPVGTFASGKVNYVNTNGDQTRLVTSAGKTLRFYPESAPGTYDNATAYNLPMPEAIPQMRFQDTGDWLAARDDTTNLIYFLKPNTSNSNKYDTDHTVDVGSYPNSLGWASDQNTLAAGLANGDIALLQLNTTSGKFFFNQSITTNHTNGVSKVFGTTARIYSAGVDPSDNNINIYWLNTTTGQWSYNWTVPNVGTNGDTVSAMYVSGNRKRVAVGQSNGDIYVLGHPDQNLEWSIAKTILAASAHGPFPINFIRVTGNGWHMLTGASNSNGQALLWTKKDNWSASTPTSANVNAQSGDWDGVYKQFTIGLYNDGGIGAFQTQRLQATCTGDSAAVSGDPSRCTCPAGQTWIQGGCRVLNCPTNTPFKNYNGFNTADGSKSCLCDAGYKWDETVLICIKDCSATANSNGTNYEYLSCYCNAGYQWDYGVSACLKYQNCTGVANSNGKNVNSNTCNCNTGYFWTGSACNAIPNSINLAAPTSYSMAPVGTFTSGKVVYVNTNGAQTRLVTSSDKTLRFYTESATGTYDNATAYNLLMPEAIPQMRYQDKGDWLAARGDSSNLIYFLKPNTSNSDKYYIDHNVSVGSYPNSLGWASDQNTLAAGLANGDIALLQFNTTSGKFFFNQSITTNHTGGVAKVFGNTARIYSAGVDASDNNINIYWLNTTTGQWSYNWTVPNVGTNGDTPTAMHVSGSEKRVVVGQSSGDIYVLGHPDQNYEWYIAKTILAASAHGSYPINFVRVTGKGWNILTAASNNKGEALLWTKNDDWSTPTSTPAPINAQSGDWDGLNRQFTIGLYNTTTGAFVTSKLQATCTAAGQTVVATDPSRCTCPAGQTWIQGGCRVLNCPTNTQFKNYNGFNTADNNNSCLCTAGYRWDESWLICVKNCNESVTPNSAGTNYEQISCSCKPGFQWDYSISACAKVCNPGYYWTNNSCAVDCVAISYSTGVSNGSGGCKCASNYRWESPLGQCVSSKGNNAALAIGLGVGIPLGILALLGLAGLLWWCCRPAPIPMMPMPPMQSMAPMVAAPVVTSRVVSPVTTTQVVRPAVKTVVPQTMTSMTRLVPNGGFQPGVGGMTSYAVGGINSGVTGFGTPIGGPSYVGQGLIGGTNGIPINRF
jgi:hypothetical protein